MNEFRTHGDSSAIDDDRPLEHDFDMTGFGCCSRCGLYVEEMLGFRFCPGRPVERPLGDEIAIENAILAGAWPDPNPAGEA